MRNTLYTLFFWGAVAAGTALAQTGPSRLARQEVDLALGYNAQRSNGTADTSFWQHGGFLELSTEAYRGFGVAMVISGGHMNHLNGSGADLNTVTTAFGPRYTFRHKKVAVFGEGLIGESHGFDGVFPSTNGALSAYDSFALQVGGGVDLQLSPHLALRPFQASWLRTEFPNATTNIQDNLQLGAGIVFRLQR